MHAPMRDGEVALLPLAEVHREALREACAADPAVWEIYPYSMLGAAFDPAFDAMLGNPARLAFVIVVDGAPVGFTSFFLDAANLVVEIGGSFLHPARRGTGLNGRVKALMLERAFGQGYRRVEFRIDTRNGRSAAAVRKLGATLDGVLRQNRVTWTGHVRDTAVYSLLAGEFTTGSR